MSLVMSATSQLAAIASQKEAAQEGSLTGEGLVASGSGSAQIGMSKKDALRKAISEDDKKKEITGDLQLVDLQESGAIFQMRSALGNRFHR
eukprot:21510-Pyramimonas_sp.AAC.1